MHLPCFWLDCFCFFLFFFLSCVLDGFSIYRENYNSNPWQGLVHKYCGGANLWGSWKALDQRLLPNPGGTQESLNLVQVPFC
jgi:hypothetical protein